MIGFKRKHMTVFLTVSLRAPTAGFAHTVSPSNASLSVKLNVNS
jgi:hypothetical protein